MLFCSFHMFDIKTETRPPSVTSQWASSQNCVCGCILSCISSSTVFDASSFPCVSVQDLSEEEGRELSPGLSYLEQVCRTLEEFARQQMQSQAAAQREGASLREQRYLEVKEEKD